MRTVDHEFPGMYDKVVNEELMLPREETINTSKAEGIIENLGNVGPGYQIVKKADGTYLFRADNIEAAKAWISSYYADHDLGTDPFAN